MIKNGYDRLLPDSFIEEAPCDVCYKLFRDKNICNVLNELISKDDMFRLKTELGRQYYLNEAEMVKDSIP